MPREFEWPKAESKGDEKILHDIRNHGCSIVGIGDADPPLSFSVGLFAKYGHAEVMIFDWRPEIAGSIINMVRDPPLRGTGCRWRYRRRLFAERLQSLLLGRAACSLSQISGHRDLVLLQARAVSLSSDHLAGRQPALPWEEGCVPEVKADQPLLKKMVS